MSTDGTLFLEQLTEKLKYRIEELETVISEGQKDVESMHEYYWENYTEMDEYGYENYDNQQALLQQVNANQDKLLLKHRFEKCWIRHSLGELILSMTGKMRQSRSISGLAILQSAQGVCRLCMIGERP